MALIHCTLVEAPVMTGYSDGRDPELSPPAGYLSQRELEEAEEPGYRDLLPWADPYIVSLVRGLEAATGAQAWAGRSRLPGQTSRRAGGWGQSW